MCQQSTKVERAGTEVDEAIGATLSRFEDAARPVRLMCVHATTNDNDDDDDDDYDLFPLVLGEM